MTRGTPLPFLQRPRGTLAWAAAVVALGAWSVVSTPFEWVPQVELQVVTVTARWPQAQPLTVERDVTAPIERAVQAIEGTRRVQSTSWEGLSRVRVEIGPDVPLSPYVLEVLERIRLLQKALPPGVTPRVERDAPAELQAEQGFMVVQLVSSSSPEVVRGVAEGIVAQRLRSVGGVRSVDVEGGRTYEVAVELLSDRMASLGVDPGGIEAALRESVADASYGTLRSGSGEAALWSAPVPSPEALHAVPIQRPASSRGARSPHLGDVARIRLQPAHVRSISRVGGQQAVTLRVERANGSGALETSDAVRDRLSALEGELPATYALVVVDDEALRIRKNLRELGFRGGSGLALVLLVLLLSLRDVGAVVAVASTTLVSMSAATIALGLAGLSLNIVTLAGIALALGLVVDNAVIVAEELQQRRGLSGEDVSAALRSVWAPMLAGTVSTAAVAAPLLYLTGELRVVMVPLGVAIAVALLASLVASAVVVPVVMVAFGRAVRTSPSRPSPPSIRGADRVYRLGLRFPKSTMAALALAFGIPLWALPSELPEPHAWWGGAPRAYNRVMDPSQSGRESVEAWVGGATRLFFERVRFRTSLSPVDPWELRVRYTLPAGSGIERADHVMRAFERTLPRSPGVERALASVGERTSSLRVTFTDDAKSTVLPLAVRRGLILQARRMAGLTVSVEGILPLGYNSSAGGDVTALTVEAYGPSYDRLDRVAKDLDAALRSDARVAHVDLAPSFGAQVPRGGFTLGWHGDTASQTSLGVREAAALIRPQLYTLAPTTFLHVDSLGLVPIRVTTHGGEIPSVARLERVPLRSKGGRAFRMDLIGTDPATASPAAIERDRQRYRRIIQVQYEGPGEFGQEAIDRAIRAVRVPVGYSLERVDPLHFRPEERRSLALVISGAIFLIVISLAVVLESWRLPFVALAALPAAGLGVAAGFLALGVPFGEGAAIGTVLLIGVAVNDNVLLVSAYREVRSASTSIGAAVSSAIRRRLRPMWTTTLTTIAGVAPLVYSSEEFWNGMALAVCSGLVMSTLLGPLLVSAALRLSEGPQVSHV